MNSRERLLAAWRKDVPDRVPIYIFGGRIHDAEWRATRPPSYAPLIAEMDEHCDQLSPWFPWEGFYLTRPELVKQHTVTRPVDEAHVDDHVTVETPAGPLTSVTRRSLIGEPGMTLKHLIAEEEDLKRFLSIPYEPRVLDASGYFEQERRVGERGLVTVALPQNPMGMTHTLMGSETLAMWSVTNRDGVLALLAELARRFEDLVKTLLGLGAGPYFSTLGHEVCLPPLQSPRDFRDFVVDIDRSVMDLIHDAGGMVHIHCHSNIREALEGFMELRTDVLHPFEAPPMGDIALAEAKKKVRGKICIEGTMQIGDLMRCTGGEIREKPALIFAAAAAGGGFILCPTASCYATVLDERQLENYRAFIHTGLELGGY